MVSSVFKDGFVNESLFDNLEYPTDKDHLGSEILKHQGISQESRQRAKCLNHETQVQLRADRLLETQQIMTQKLEVEKTKHNKLMEANVQCEAKIKDIAVGLGVSAIADFDKPNKSELIAFVHVRSFSTVEKPKHFGPWPKKGKSSEAIAGTRCLVRLAYDCRDKRVILLEPASPITTEDQPAPRHLGATVLKAGATTINAKLASALLCDCDWVTSLLSTFRLNAENINPVNNALMGKADNLQNQLARRLAYLVSSRVPDNKQDHWCFQFTLAKLGFMSATMVIFNHVKEDIESKSDKDCLLAKPNSFRLVTELLVEDGAYLYYDDNDCKWIRAGMVAGRKFWERGLEHKKGSILKTVQDQQSRFYSSYPSREANGSSSNGARRGWHDNLQQYAALGFPLAKTVEPLVELFELSEADNNNINTINFRKAGGGSPTLFDRQRRAIHYLCECCYGLCLAPSDNISSNPGWEQDLGYYGK
jgi:hypothetical protein